MVCGDDKQTTPNKFGKEVCAECVKLCCAECCGEFGEDCALPLKEGGALCRDCDPNYWAWQEARDAEEERTSPEEFAQALLESNPALAKMLYDHLADKFNNDPKEDEEEDGWSEECNQCNIVLDESTGREWIAELGCLCAECYELRKGDFPSEE